MVNANPLAVQNLSAPKNKTEDPPVVSVTLGASRLSEADSLYVGLQSARGLRTVVPFMAPTFATRSLSMPILAPRYIEAIANIYRSKLGLHPGARPTTSQIIQLMADAGIVLVPILSTEEISGNDAVMSVYLNDCQLALVLFNLGASVPFFCSAMAYELGRFLVRPTLGAKASEQFGEQFANILVPPLSESATPDRSPYAGFFSKFNSPGTPSFTTSFPQHRAEPESISFNIFCTSNPSAKEVVLRSEALLITPIFRALANMRRSVGLSTHELASFFNLRIYDAEQLLQALDL